MTRKLWSVLCAAVLLAALLLPAGSLPARAQAPASPAPQDCPPGESCAEQTARAPLDAPLAPAAAGGPDDYGYTWNDGSPVSWVDVTGGTDLGFSGSTRTLSGAIPLPFSFKYYQNTYSQVYVSPTGYLTFNSQGVASQGKIPDPSTPNNLIAPYWVPLTYANSGVSGRAFYKTGGSAPNRYFAVEWYQVSSYGEGNFTFEVQLFENGDFRFQYQQMTIPSWYYCETIGFENANGIDGLAYLPYCSRPPSSNFALQVTRPAAGARVGVDRLYQGALTRSGYANGFGIQVTNLGELGADVYDVTVTSTWPVALYGPDGSTPLTDTDSDGKVDTGSIAQGASKNITAAVTTPAGQAAGAANAAQVRLTSSKNTAKNKMVRLETTVPAPFSQIFDDANQPAATLDRNWPEMQTAQAPAGPSQRGYEPAVVEVPNQSILSVWEKSRTTSPWGYILQYSLANPYGGFLRPPTDLTQLDGSATFAYDESPALAAAPDGRLGVTWYRMSINSSSGTYLYNYNIWYAVLNPDGSLAVPPTNLTSSTTWLPDCNETPCALSPTIAASGDNRFMIAWYQYSVPGGKYLAEIFTTIRTTAGAVVAPTARLAEGVPETTYYRSPSLTALSGSRFLLTYSYYNRPTSGSPITAIRYRAYNSSRGVVKDETSAGFDGVQSDGAQLSGGNVLLASNRNGNVNYTVLNGSSLNPLGSFAPLSHPSAPASTANVSVAADASNRAVLTWRDGFKWNLYYALLSASGAPINGAVIYRAAAGSQGLSLDVSYSGCGITSNSWQPPASVDAFVSFSQARYGVPPTQKVDVVLNYANHGLKTAANPTLTIKLPAGLAYLGSDDSCVPSGNTLTCHPAAMPFLFNARLTLQFQVPGGTPPGQVFALHAAITTAGPEADPSNNSADAQVITGDLSFLPKTNR